jgi:hypothetical protein
MGCQHSRPHLKPDSNEAVHREGQLFRQRLCTSMNGVLDVLRDDGSLNVTNAAGFLMEVWSCSTHSSAATASGCSIND